jgi:hypothetical protein
MPGRALSALSAYEVHSRQLPAARPTLRSSPGDWIVMKFSRATSACRGRELLYLVEVTPGKPSSPEPLPAACRGSRASRCPE